MSDSKKNMNNVMEGGYYAPLLSSSIMTTLLGLAAFFFLRKKAEKDKKMSSHECSNLKECLKRRVNLYHILGLTAKDVNSRPDKIKSKIRQVQPQNIPPICKPLFNVAYKILTNPQKKASYDIVFEISKDQFKFPETPDTFRDICQLELQRLHVTTTQTVQQQELSAPSLQQTQEQEQEKEKEKEKEKEPPSPPSDKQSPIQVMDKLVNSPENEKPITVHSPENEKPITVYSPENEKPITVHSPENEKPGQSGGYTHNDKLYHQKYIKYKQKYMQLVNELTY